ncbi:galactokinase family protein [uncultured Oscillibacter sp.]|uniref:galactokinase n=1 Tax=uncultured Oscillibacter sp. TaxID=876091 RepID=UPI0025E6F3B7|nr:galactokinase family protein [uncultured Oscillibacter sp.]
MEQTLRERLEQGGLNETLQSLYGAAKLETAQSRCAGVLEGFAKTFGREAEALFSAPGRTELGGNHTDHQHGRVLAAGVDLDILAAAAVNDSGMIRVQSEGYPLISVDLERLTPVAGEENTTAALIRGVAARMREMGCPVGGVEAYMVSDVPGGSGLSSSAAFEVLIGTMLGGLFWDGRASAVEIAQIGQYAENVFFGKPCGLMDQTASSVGGVVAIDFADPANPVVEQIPLDLAATGHALCIIDSGADHADLTDEYAAVPEELRAICRHFGKEVLREVPEQDFIAALPELRRKCGDRAVLRAIHIYDDNARVRGQVGALRRGDFDAFLMHVRDSGLSSWRYLQNVVPAGYKEHQDVAFALALAERLLDTAGACRVHGGGFAGTIQAFVPLDMLEKFKSGIEAVLGRDSCHVVAIRPVGGVRLDTVQSL